MEPQSENDRTVRWRPRWYFPILLFATFVAIIGYRWSTLELERDLFSSRLQQVRIEKALRWSGDEWSRSDDEALMERAGADLRSRIESRLNENGFVQRGEAEQESAREYKGRYNRSPPIRLSISDHVGIDEGGVHYEISIDYVCSVPRGSAGYQKRVSEIVEAFEEQLQNWLETSRDELLAEHPEYRRH